MFKIALNAGHGINTAGKRCLKSIDPNETREWSLNSRICNKIQTKLKSYDGYELIRLDDTTGVTDVALTTRTNKANSFGANFYLAIHHNAGINGGSGGGLETYTYPGTTGVTKEWQKDLYNACIAHSGLKGNRSNGVREQDLHEVRESNMPAVLIECGFMDSTVDTPIILTDTFAEQIADACVEVLVRRGGLKKKNVEPMGYLDTVDAHSITGWAYNRQNDNPVEVHIYIYNAKGETVNAFSGIAANMFREDLKKANIGNGNHAFNFKFDFSQMPEGTYTIKAFAIGGSNPQLNGTASFTVQPKPIEQPVSKAEDTPKVEVNVKVENIITNDVPITEPIVEDKPVDIAATSNTFLNDSAADVVNVTSKNIWSIILDGIIEFLKKLTSKN